VVGHFQGGLLGEVELLHQVHYTPTSHELDGRFAVEDDVVVHLVAASVGHDAGDRMADVRKLAQPSEMVLVHVEVAQQDHVILAAAVSLDAGENVGQGVQFALRFVGIGVDVNEIECERFVGGHATNTKASDQWLTVE